MKKYSLQLFALYLCLSLSVGCQPVGNESSSPEAQTAVVGNPAADGFDAVNSDEKAIAIADEVMDAMGGRAAWNNTRHIAWNFFGFRKLIWDKWTGDVRVETPGKDMVALLNIHSMEGKVKIGEQELTDADSLAKYLDIGKRAWINDSYWLVMPYKLKDSGVTLKYVEAGATEDGAQADVLSLTFKEVGVTPQNRYHVFVDKESRRVTQWAFYRNAEDEKPGFITPWAGYETHGEILLGGDRGERDGKKRELTQISVHEELPEAVYASFEAVDWDNL